MPVPTLPLCVQHVPRSSQPIKSTFQHEACLTVPTSLGMKAHTYHSVTAELSKWLWLLPVEEDLGRTQCYERPLAVCLHIYMCVHGVCVFRQCSTLVRSNPREERPTPRFWMRQKPQRAWVDHTAIKKTLNRVNKSINCAYNLHFTAV